MGKILRALLRFLSPKGKLGRKGFLLVFICAILAVVILLELGTFLWFKETIFPNGKVNMLLSFMFMVTEMSFLLGLMPVLAYMLFECIISLLIIGSIPLLITALFAGFLLVIYIFQCIKRCRDMGVHVLYCFMPIFNPFVMLMMKSNEKEGSVWPFFIKIDNELAERKEENIKDDLDHEA